MMFEGFHWISSRMLPPPPAVKVRGENKPVYHRETRLLRPFECNGVGDFSGHGQFPQAHRDAIDVLSLRFEPVDFLELLTRMKKTSSN